MGVHFLFGTLVLRAKFGDGFCVASASVSMSMSVFLSFRSLRCHIWSVAVTLATTELPFSQPAIQPITWNRLISARRDDDDDDDDDEQRIAWRGMAWRGVAWLGVAWRASLEMSKTVLPFCLPLSMKSNFFGNRRRRSEHERAPSSSSRVSKAFKRHF